MIDNIPKIQKKTQWHYDQKMIEKVQKLIFWRERVLNPLHLAREENLLEP